MNTSTPNVRLFRCRSKLVERTPNDCKDGKTKFDYFRLKDKFGRRPSEIVYPGRFFPQEIKEDPSIANIQSNQHTQNILELLEQPIDQRNIKYTKVGRF